MKKPIFTGAAVAIITPMKADGSVDYEEFGRFIDWQIENGTDAIVVCGTTGESSTLEVDEHSECIKWCVDYVAGRCAVIAGTGSNSTRTAIELSQEACKDGADALLLVTPYYNKTSQRGLIAHYKAIHDATDKPIILYNVPSRTGMNIQPQTALELSKLPRINGVKEASGNLEQIVDGNGDNDWEVVSVNKNVLVIDRDFIGELQTYVCRAHYNTGGTQASAPVSADPTVTTTIRRRIPKVECDWKGVTCGVPGGTMYILPIGFIRDSMGVIPNPEEWFKFVWYTKAAGAASFTRAAIGIQPKVPFADGMMLELRVEDKGPQALVVDDDDTNVFITLDDDTPLYQRMYEETY